MEATGISRASCALFAEPGFELWIVDPAESRPASEEQKTPTTTMLELLLRRLMLRK